MHTLEEKIRERGKTKPPPEQRHWTQLRLLSDFWPTETFMGSPQCLWEVHSVYGKSIVFVGSPQCLREVHSVYGKSIAPTRSDVKVTVPLFSERNV